MDITGSTSSKAAVLVQIQSRFAPDLLQIYYRPAPDLLQIYSRSSSDLLHISLCLTRVTNAFYLASKLHFALLNIVEERRWEFKGEGYVHEVNVKVVINEQTAGAKCKRPKMAL